MAPACLAQTLDLGISFQCCNIITHFKQLVGWSALPRAQEGPAAGEEAVRGWHTQKGNFSRKCPKVFQPSI